ncbi:hypothetical protein IFM89_028849 [Coptis chinensis]|uniref:C2H2-type domain-containing protein n=1 Tax=Coptis chinensis TaxID=261450 RepID=A0A835H9H7_9MAGN|nr:hypothetical protein IFM89_028849 [Coptis chinensis]
MGTTDHVHIVKGKRTKRQRPSSPLAAFDMTTSNSSSGEVGASGDGGGGDGHIYGYQSPTNSVELGESTEEEEDMANCLILLARGHNTDVSKRIDDHVGAMEKFSSRRFAEAPTTTTSKAGFYVYQCKTCNRCFSSFQALGGHRASHKKPKAMVGEKKTLMLLEDDTQFNNNISSINLQMGNRTSSHTTNKSKVHECSICGSEFSSGQALGGHMRRHRTPTTANMTNSIAMDTIMTESQDTKKPRNALSLDLNLPAPEEDRESKFSFASKQHSLLFSASSLVDCHF